MNEEVDNAVDKILALIERKKFKKAEKRLAELYSKYPNYHMVQYAMGALFAFKGQNDQAISHLKKAVDIYPNFAEAYYNLGVVYKKNLDVPNMVKYLEKAVDMSDADSDIHRQAKILLNSVEDIIREQSGTNLETYIRAQEQFKLGVEFMERNEWKKAIHAFSASARIVNTMPPVYGNMAICHAHLGNKSEALAALDRALELEPQYELAIVNRKIIQSLPEGEKLGDKIKMVEYYKEFPMKNRSYIQYVIEEGLRKLNFKIPNDVQRV
ncbi:MAG: tetratricopeptide repeat protein [Deltaproteobacteria bacterium]|nr:tetratricopeptide repeat protein [Deltaproteobacteria bacterium]